METTVVVPRAFKGLCPEDVQQSQEQSGSGTRQTLGLVGSGDEDSEHRSTSAGIRHRAPLLQSEIGDVTYFTERV